MDEKYVDQKNHQMVTYIMGKAYDKIIYSSSSTKIKKKIFWLLSQKKKDCLLAEVKKKFAASKNSIPPPHISNGASLTPDRLNYVTLFSVKAVLPWELQLRLEIQVNADCLISFSNIVI